MATLSLVLIAAWFVASNHCLLAARPAAHISPGHCSGHNAPEKKESGGCADQNCCKSLSAPASGLAKNLVGGEYLAFQPADFSACATALVAQPTLELAAGSDTGPPGEYSFAESVLQHSLLAHAPPRFA